ncbi:MAG: glycosyltransferase family 4 protein [Patescibacteria group bacterium]|nr:glycosyltransferase family 4 protein [Patescibacteria group bacterium]
MKLLIVTQAVDTEDPVLGFFVRWIEELAKHSERVEVICLKEGKYSLPENVRVHSLGKPASRFRYVSNFYKYIFSRNYDAVFVHMNQEYVLLGGWFWRLVGKKVFLWRNHKMGSWLTRLAVLFSHTVFYTSRQSFTAPFKNAHKMPVGIDTDFYKPNALVPKKPNSILFLGRIAPVKNIDIFIDALNELQKLGVEFTASVAGSALSKDSGYEKAVRNKVSDYGLTSKVQFVGPVTQDEALKLYREHRLYVNLTPSGSMDKTIFEAMACGVTPLVYNDDLRSTLGDGCLVKNLRAQDIAGDIKKILSGECRNFRNQVIENHSLRLLAEKLSDELI